MKKGIIVASFGTTFAETRRLSIESIENRIRDEYEEFLVLRAFTSKIVMKRLKKRDNLHIYDVKEALEKMKENGVKQVFIQPLHIIMGIEYGKIIKAVDKFKIENGDMSISIGKPLLDCQEDYEIAVKALNLKVKEKDKATLFMGHGSYHTADISYKKLQEEIDKNYENVYIATVEGDITLEDVLVELKKKDIKKVNLRPFMLVAGDHATNDMASSEEDSWKSILEREGIKVGIDMTSLGQLDGIRDIFIEHLKRIII